jgi:ArsR family transcriptional regulator
MGMAHRTIKLSSADVERIAKALADPQRMKLLGTISASEEFACRRLCRCVPLAKATISHHLRELQRAGLIDVRREGSYMYLRARRDVLTAYAEQLLRVGQSPAASARGAR